MLDKVLEVMILSTSKQVVVVGMGAICLTSRVLMVLVAVVGLGPVVGGLHVLQARKVDVDVDIVIVNVEGYEVSTLKYQTTL